MKNRSGDASYTELSPAPSQTDQQLQIDDIVHRLVAEEDTVPPEVRWETKYRTCTDKFCAIFFFICYINFIGTVIGVCLKAQPKYVTKDDVYQISPYYLDDVKTCCDKIANSGETLSGFDLCSDVAVKEEEEEAMFRRRRLTELKGDEGIFEAFLEAPQIIVGLLAIAIVICVMWAFMLQLCAPAIVWATEGVKVAILIYMGVVSETTNTLYFCIFLAILQIFYSYYLRQNIIRAGKVLSQAAAALGKNKKVFLGVAVVFTLYVLNSWMFVLFYSRGYQVTQVDDVETCYGGTCYTSCVFTYPSYMSYSYTFVCFIYGWSVFLLSTIRLSNVATIVGSWHFHANDGRPKATVLRAFENSMTTSLGTLSIAALVSTVADWVKRVLMEPWWKSWMGCMCCFTVPLQVLMCVFGAALETLIQMYTKFAVIIHVFTGLSFAESGEKVQRIMTRHFVGGFVTEITSESVLNLGSYVFSLGMMFSAWAWFDKVFGTNTLAIQDVGNYALMMTWMLFGLFNLWYPTLGIYVIVIVNRWLVAWEEFKIRLQKQVDDSDSQGSMGDFWKSISGSTQQYWLSPLAAIFVGCISMMFFNYVAGVFKDTVSVMFMCFAIDKDSNIDLTRGEMYDLIMAMGDNVVIAQPVTQPSSQKAEGTRDDIAKTQIV